jgi:hypothetical protein
MLGHKDAIVELLKFELSFVDFGIKLLQLDIIQSFSFGHLFYST